MQRRKLLTIICIVVAIVAIVAGVLAIYKPAGQVTAPRKPKIENVTKKATVAVGTHKLCAYSKLFTVCVSYKIGREGNVTYVELKDALNRTVRVRYPAKRIVVAFYPQLYVAVLGKEWTKYVVGWRARSWKAYRYDYYTTFIRYYPEIANISNIGDLYRGTFDVEKVVQLRPDVVFVDVSQSRFRDVLKKVEDAGIPVVFIDHGKTLLGPVRSMLIIGVITGKIDRASEIATWVLDKLSIVFERIKKIKENSTLWRRYKVFLERGFRLWYTQGRYGWGKILYDLGGINIAENKIVRIGEIDPEYVTSQNPDIWIITCSWCVKRPNTPLCGVGIINKTLIIERAIKFIKFHKGIEKIRAVQKGNVWLIYHDLDHNFNFFGYMLLAKMLYPDVFRDINVTA